MKTPMSPPYCAIVASTRSDISAAFRPDMKAEVGPRVATRAVAQRPAASRTAAASLLRLAGALVGAVVGALPYAIYDERCVGVVCRTATAPSRVDLRGGQARGGHRARTARRGHILGQLRR